MPNPFVVSTDGVDPVDGEIVSWSSAAGARVIAEGDAVVIDFGGTVGGYGSDTTRMFHVGEPSAKYLEVHAVVAAALHCDLDLVQLHGHEPPGFCRELADAGIPLIKALVPDSGLLDYSGVVQFYLFDNVLQYALHNLKVYQEFFSFLKVN